MVVAAFLILLFVIAGCLCSVWGRPSEGIGIPVIAIATFAFVYLGQPAYMMWNDQLQYFFTDAMVVKALLVPAAALLCLMWGWRRGSRGMCRFAFRTASTKGWSAQLLYSYGLAAACVGTALHLVFVARSGGFLAAYGQTHGQGFSWTENTAYLYMSPLWVQSGLAMMILSGGRLKLSAWRRAAIALFAVALALNGILLGSRHDVFSICAILWVGWSLARRSRPTIARAAPALVVACVGALLMLGYRGILHLGANKPEAPTLTEAATAGFATDNSGLRLRTSGVEFVVHASTLETVDKTQKYHLAINWVYLYTVDLIPRIWWPEKPYSFKTPGITSDDVLSVTGVRLAWGCAPGIVADLYTQFGLFSLLFFMWLGWCARRLFLRAQSGYTPLAMCAYIMVFSLSLNVFGQGFGAILAPWPYSMAPVLLYHWVERNRLRHLTSRLVVRSPLHPAAIGPIS